MANTSGGLENSGDPMAPTGAVTAGFVGRAVKVERSFSWMTSAVTLAFTKLV